MSSVTLNNKTYCKGDTITLNKTANSICFAPAGLRVKIVFIRDNSVGLYSPDQRVDRWSDLDGEVENRRGWWIDKRKLALCIDGWNDEYEIATSLKHCGVDLKGKPCHMLAGLDNGTVFVEFEEDVNGCSADGLGKSGHCVAVNTKVLTKKKREKHVQ